jgi:hypothetical protein
MALFDSTPGRFVQIGHQPTPTGTAPDGYGKFVTVQALEQKERERVLEKLEQLRPELIAKGVEVTRAKADADAAAEAFRKELHAAVGGDGLRAAMAVIHETMARQAQAATAKPAQASTQPAKK